MLLKVKPLYKLNKVSYTIFTYAYKSMEVCLNLKKNIILTLTFLYNHG
jgi:hypothetical protein